MIPRLRNQCNLSLSCACSNIVCTLCVTLCTLWQTCDIIIETDIEWRKIKIFQNRLKLQRGKHLKLNMSLRKISILRFYFLVSSTPNWTLVKNFTHIVIMTMEITNFFIIVFKQYFIHNLQVVYIYLLHLHGNGQFRQFLLSSNWLALGYNDPQWLSIWSLFTLHVDCCLPREIQCVWSLLVSLADKHFKTLQAIIHNCVDKGWSSLRY